MVRNLGRILAAVVLLSALASSLGWAAEKTLFVAPYKQEGMALGPQMCLLVSDKPTGPFLRHYSGIAGFSYQWGYRYELRVREDRVTNGPADLPSLRWTLVKIVRRQAVAPGETFALTLSTKGVHPQSDGSFVMHGDKSFILGHGLDRESFLMLLRMSSRFTRQFAFGAGPNRPLVLLGDEVSAEGRLWRLSALEGKALVAGSEITLQLCDGKLSGSAGVNQYSATYRLDGNSLGTSPLSSTKMMGRGDLMLQENRYLELLGRASIYEVGRSSFKLLDAAGRLLLQFGAPSPLAAAGNLEGRKWYLRGLPGKSLIAGSAITLQLADGKYGGSSGVNYYGGDYQIDGKHLRLGSVTITKMMGRPELMGQEYAYLDLLAKVRSYVAGPWSLTLLDASGANLLHFGISNELESPTEDLPVKLTAPRNGERVGRAVDVVGQSAAGRKVLIEVVTDVYVGTRLAGSVPGQRHWTGATGRFQLRVAAPLVAAAAVSELRYVIRVYELHRNGTRGPEAKVTVYPAR